jgi:hypothetical protein
LEGIAWPTPIKPSFKLVARQLSLELAILHDFRSSLSSSRAMSSITALQAIVLPLIASCAIVGGYGTMFMGTKNGFFDAATTTAGRPKDPYIPGGVHPLKTTFTGVAPIDSQLQILVGFFSYIIDGERTWGVTASYWYLILQFLPACLLLFLEGSRKGNAGRIVSW